VRDVQRDRRNVVVQLLAVAAAQPREPARLHADGQVLPLGVTGRNQEVRREAGYAALLYQQEADARVEAFLTVPLFERVFEQYKGFTLPNAAAIERFMSECGVAPKQKDRARQAFTRSTRQAGLFAHGEDRLVRPSFPDGGRSTRPIDPAGDGENSRRPARSSATWSPEVEDCFFRGANETGALHLG
jgi:hypothetical protein